ncbi:MAG TPA: tetratricopeptide repeat protein [Gemmataceae bacterium]
MIGGLRKLLRGARRRRRAVALTLLVLGGLAAYFGGWYLWRHSQYRAAEQALDRNEFAEARARLGRCLRWWPDDAGLHLLAARAARRDGDFAAAEEHLGHYRRLGGEPEAAALERAMLIAQRDGPARVEGFLLSRVKGQSPPDLLALEALSESYLKAYRLPEALYCLDLWLEQQPANVRALIWRGQVLERSGDPGEAIASYRRAVAADPGHAEARRHLALALVRSDRAEEAAAHLERLCAESPDPELLLGLARCRRSTGRVDEARRLLDEVLAARPDDPEALRERGKLALQTGRAVEAERWLRTAVAQAPYDREANYTLYLCLLRQGREEEAARTLETVERIRTDFQRVSDLFRRLAASPRDASLRCELGVILLRNGQARQGIHWLRSALQIDPHHPEALRALAEVSGAGGNGKAE